MKQSTEELKNEITASDSLENCQKTKRILSTKLP